MSKVEVGGGFSPAYQEEAVKCDVCKIELEGVWADEVRGMLGKLHIKLCPFCPKVKDLREFKAMKGLTDHPLNIDAMPVKPKPVNIVMVQESGDDQHAFFSPEVKHPKYSSETSRRDATSSAPDESFLSAGFFSNPPPSDKMTCFWCDGSLEGWKPGEIPIVEHAKYYPGCAFVRQQKGTNFIYNHRNQMTPKEKQSASCLRYNPNLEILYEFYPSYDDINTRTRSLIYMGIDESNAFLLAINGLYYDPEKDTISCFHCGLNILKCVPLTQLQGIHTQKSKACLGNLDATSDGPSPDDSVDYVICFPCEHVVKKLEEDCCPERNRSKVMKNFMHRVYII